MDEVLDLSDNRLVNGCLYCGGPAESRDHVPSRVFLDRPYPAHPPVVGACLKCNSSFSLDEPYVACLIEAVIAGSTEPDEIKRSKIGNILRKRPALRARLEAAKQIVGGQIHFEVEPERIRNVVLKLARGHAAFELSKVCRNVPASIWWFPLHLMTETEREDFDSIHIVNMLGEIGSRSTQRMCVTQVLDLINGGQSTQNVVFIDWLEVQDERYRYLAIDDVDEIKIKIIISEYLACEVIWTQ